MIEHFIISSTVRKSPCFCSFLLGFLIFFFSFYNFMTLSIYAAGVALR